jgi:hypothetical protein
MRCDVQLSYDSSSKSRILDLRLGRKTQSISITTDLLAHMKNPSKSAVIRAEIELKLRPHLVQHIGLTESEMQTILDVFLANDDD